MHNHVLCSKRAHACANFLAKVETFLINMKCGLNPHTDRIFIISIITCLPETCASSAAFLKDSTVMSFSPPFNLVLRELKLEKVTRIWLVAERVILEELHDIDL